MVGGKRSRRKRTSLLGSHQKCWLWGRHAVVETLRAGRWPPLELWLADEADPLLRDEVLRRAETRRIPVEHHPAADLTRRCGTLEHQGFLARMPAYPYASESELLPPRHRPSLLIVLDQLQDPFNFGAIVRTAEVLGAAGIFVSRRNQSEVTAQVVRSSAGAVNHVPIVQVGDLMALVGRLRQGGIHVAAASEKAVLELAQFRAPQSCALVIGNEGTGADPALQATCDSLIRIPQSGKVGSLNAAVAAGILMYEVVRQWRAESVPPIG